MPRCGKFRRSASNWLDAWAAPQDLQVWERGSVDLMHFGPEARPMVAIPPVLPLCEDICMDHLMQQDILPGTQ